MRQNFFKFRCPEIYKMEVLSSPHSFGSELSNGNENVKCNVKGVSAAGKILIDQSQTLAVRFRALFVLRNLKCDESVKYIAQCFGDPSALLKHELAYCLGQMQNCTAIPYLISVLEDFNQEGIVRHEAGEALAAIGNSSSIEVLEKFINDPVQEVAETCQLALKRLQWLHSKNTEDSRVVSAYNSVDPAPALTNTKDVDAVAKILVDENLPLWDRYKAMFTLRNISSEEDDRAVKALAQGLKCANSGALFRHEIAYVLGQIQSPAVITDLTSSLCDQSESPMVRHECAEALGSIATPECMDLVRRYAADEERIVRESCVVALDMAEYEQSNEFQYATLSG